MVVRLAAGVVAVVCGLVGCFLVLRAQTFAGHALSHVGFAGATGAVLIGIAPLWGLIAMTLAGGWFGSQLFPPVRAHKRRKRIVTG